MNRERRLIELERKSAAEVRALATEMIERHSLMLKLGLDPELAPEHRELVDLGHQALEEIGLAEIDQEERQHARWQAWVNEEIRLAALFDTRLVIYRKNLSPRQKAWLSRRLGRKRYMELPW